MHRFINYVTPKQQFVNKLNFVLDIIVSLLFYNIAYFVLIQWQLRMTCSSPVPFSGRCNCLQLLFSNYLVSMILRTIIVLIKVFRNCHIIYVGYWKRCHFLMVVYFNHHLSYNCQLVRLLWQIVSQLCRLFGNEYFFIFSHYLWVLTCYNVLRWTYTFHFKGTWTRLSWNFFFHFRCLKCLTKEFQMVH